MERRQLLRNLAVRQRPHGLNAQRMLTSRQSIVLTAAFLAISLILPDGVHKVAFIVMGIYFFSQYHAAMFYQPVHHHHQLHRRDRRIRDYDDAQFRLIFRFHKEHAVALMHCLELPEHDIIVDNGSRFHPEEAFLILLHRMAVYNRLTDMEREFGIEYTQLNRIFNYFVEYIVGRHYHKLYDNIAFFVPRFARYNAAIRDKILSTHHELPAAAIDTALFIDGTSREICRPGHHQGRVYNGHHHVHSLQFQGVSAPDGMIVDLFGPLPGCRHDQVLNDRSMLNQRLAAAQLNNNIQWKGYSDKGYVEKTHQHVAHRGVHLPAQLQMENELMSPQRVGVEWAFHRVCSEFAYVDHYKVAKVQLSQVAKIYCLAALLANAYTCLYHSQASVYWNCPPPTLGSYFNKPDIPF